jgi:chemotaxis protein MotB
MKIARSLCLLPLITSLVLLPGCLVKKKDLDAALATLADQETELDGLAAQLNDCEASLEQSRGDLERTQGDLAACDARAAELTTARDGLAAEGEALRQALKKRGADLSRLTQEADMLSQSLVETQRAMEEMRAREAAAEERNRIYAQLLDRFQEMIDAGTLDVSIEDGRIVINLKQDILFDSGSDRVGDEGKETLVEVAAALAEFPDRSFQVEGHTDDVPIQTARFPSNWELSTARSTSVVMILIEGGVLPANVSAAGFGEFRPRADNETDEGKALNRRIEIIMVPQLQQLPDPDEV